MEEYVAKSVLKKELNISNLHAGIIDALQNIVDEIPAADVEEVKHGEWQNKLYYPLTNSYYHICSVCGKELKITFTDNYCPNCGAKMDEKENEK